MNTSRSDHAKLWDLVEDIRFGMLTHRHPGGMLHAHPLTTQNKRLDDPAVLYFFISRDSELHANLRVDGNVNLAYADPDDSRYVSVSGQARIVEDQALKNELWTRPAEAWFPDGPTDKDLALLAIDVDHAECWDGEENKMVQLYKIAKAMVKGERPKNLGEHRELHV